MHYRTVAALLFAFAVSLSYAQLWSGNGTVAENAPYNATLGPFNFQTTATLTITYSRLVSVCIVYANYKLPRWTEYNTENCLFYFNATKEGSETYDKIQLLQFEYQIGVFLASPIVNKGDNSTIHLTLTGAVCPSADEYYDGSATCVKATPITSNNFSASFGPGETKFWTYETTSGLSWLLFKMMSVGDISAENSVISARYMGGSYALPDLTDNNGTLRIVSPRQGTWVFSVHHGGNGGMADFTLDQYRCGVNSAGDHCMIPVAPAYSNMSLTLEKESWLYLHFTVDEKQALLVSVTTNNGSDIPYLFAGNGQIPVQHGTDGFIADIRNCNRDYCSIVRSIVRNITAPGVGATEDWYVGIYNHLGGNVSFGLWWNNSCVPECESENHGECEESGRCQCEIDFEGIDCSVSKGLGPQYIVLIIIASLVVASAIIGFVAWAYMRRKRANYEIVS